MKHSQIEHVVVDEVHQRTYVVRAGRPLTDGEIYRCIRRELLRRGGQRLAKGETLTLDAVQNPNSTVVPLSH